MANKIRKKLVMIIQCDISQTTMVDKFMKNISGDYLYEELTDMTINFAKTYKLYKVKK